MSGAVRGCLSLLSLWEVGLGGGIRPAESSTGTKDSYTHSPLGLAVET